MSILRVKPRNIYVRVPCHKSIRVGIICTLLAGLYALQPTPSPPPLLDLPPHLHHYKDCIGRICFRHYVSDIRDFAKASVTPEHRQGEMHPKPKTYDVLYVVEICLTYVKRCGDSVMIRFDDNVHLRVRMPGPGWSSEYRICQSKCFTSAHKCSCMTLWLKNAQGTETKVALL